MTKFISPGQAEPVFRHDPDLHACSDGRWVLFLRPPRTEKTYALHAISVLPRSRHLGLAYVRKTAIGRLIARKVSFMAIATFMTTTARIYVQTYAIYRLLLKLPTIICMCC